MNLIDALKTLGSAVGDGKIIPTTAYVRSDGERLHVTDGRQYASADCAQPPFCVRYDALVRAVSREGATVVSDNRNGLQIRYAPRGRATLRGVDPAEMPTPAEINPRESLVYTLPPSFKETLATLSKFIGENDGQVWTQGVHLAPDFMFACSHNTAVRRLCNIAFQNVIALPKWAVQFITSRDESPTSLLDGRQLLMFKWEDGVTLVTTLLAQDAPESAMTLISNIEGTNISVPEGFKEAIGRFKEYGAKHLTIENGVAKHETIEFDVEEVVDIDGPPRLWNVDRLAEALEFATHIDITGQHGIWCNAEYRGMFAGMNR